MKYANANTKHIIAIISHVNLNPYADVIADPYIGALICPIPKNELKIADDKSFTRYS
jgi:hypothetical protein